ncbi:MAG: class II fructose-bisphosphate aldolase, partial [Pseudomonadota bacterium]
IEAVSDVPLVIHGGSGVPAEQRKRLAANSAICKFNIGTELRLAFGKAVRNALDDDPGLFDRIAILTSAEPAVEAAARHVIRTLGAAGKAAAQ